MFGAVAQGADAFAELPGTRHDDFFGKVREHAGNGRAIVAAALDGDHAGAIDMINREYGASLGLDEEGRAKVDEIAQVIGTAQQAVSLADDKGDYFGAARLLLGEAAERTSSPAVKARLTDAAQVFERLGGIAGDIDDGRLSKAADEAMSLLGEPLDARTRERVMGLLERIDDLRGTDVATPAAA